MSRTINVDIIKGDASFIILCVDFHSEFISNIFISQAIIKTVTWVFNIPFTNNRTFFFIGILNHAVRISEGLCNPNFGTAVKCILFNPGNVNNTDYTTQRLFSCFHIW